MKDKSALIFVTLSKRKFGTSLTVFSLSITIFGSAFTVTSNGGWPEDEETVDWGTKNEDEPDETPLGDVDKDGVNCEGPVEFLLGPNLSPLAHFNMFPFIFSNLSTCSSNSAISAFNFPTSPFFSFLSFPGCALSHAKSASHNLSSRSNDWKDNKSNFSEISFKRFLTFSSFSLTRSALGLPLAPTDDE